MLESPILLPWSTGRGYLLIEWDDDQQLLAQAGYLQSKVSHQPAPRGGTSEGASVSRTGTAKKLPETPPSTRTRAPVQLSEGDKKEDCYKVRHPILRVSITQREIEKDGFRRNTGL